jgi:hypothetical protein
MEGDGDPGPFTGSGFPARIQRCIRFQEGIGPIRPVNPIIAKNFL